MDCIVGSNKGEQPMVQSTIWVSPKVFRWNTKAPGGSGKMTFDGNGA